MGLILEDDGFTREDAVRLGYLSQEGIKCCSSETRISSQSTQALLLNDQQVDC